MSKTRKELEQEVQRDEVAETLQNIAENVRRNRNILITMAVLIVLALLTLTAVRSSSARKLAESNNMMDAALQRYGMLISQTDPQQRQDALKDAVAAANQLAEAYPSTKLGREALFLRGKAYYAVDDFENARKAYQEYLDKATNDEERARGQIALGYTLENKSFMTDKKDQRATLNQALDHYVQAAGIAAGGNAAKPELPYLYYYALMGQARYHELVNDDAKAIALYKQVVDARPEPVPATKAVEETEGAQDGFMDFLREQLADAEGQLSYQATVKLRLDRLQSTPQGPARVEATASTESATSTATQATKP